MKKSKRILLVIVLLLLLVLSSCTSAITGSSWPGITNDNGTLYVAYANRVYAIQSSDGSTLWSYPEKAGRTLFYAAPVLANGQLIVGDYDNILHSLDPKTGTENWQFSQAKNDWVASPLVIGDTILAPNSDHTLYALTFSGQVKWTFATKGPLWSKPVSDGSLVFQASMDHNLYAIDLQTGQQKWSLALGGAVPYTPTLADNGTLYLTTIAQKLIAVNSADGTITWEKQYDSSLWSEPLLVQDNLYFGDLDGNIYAVSAADGSTVWTQSVGEPVTGKPTLSGDNILFPTEQGNIIAVNQSGTRQWSMNFDGPLYTGPVEVGDHLAVGIVSKNTFLALITPTGQTVWSYVPPK